MSDFSPDSGAHPGGAVLMIDIEGCTLTAGERARLCDPRVGGLILFSRNYRDPAQLAGLCAEIHALRTPPLLIAVDHEGGRVQRFREGFTRLPPMARLGRLWDADPQGAVRRAAQLGYVLAAELRARGVDFSFTPDLDLDYGLSTVIGERAFHRRPEAVVALAGALIDGLRAAGMACCGKHFPGHGGVTADSHVAQPVDTRPLAALQEDLRPYRQLSLDAVMPAHVVYPDFDDKTACFSSKWINYLRNDVKFDGLVFSDDLAMSGAALAGDALARVKAAEVAGCDVLLLCNAPEQVGYVLDGWQPKPRQHPPGQGARRDLSRLIPTTPAPDWENLQNAPDYRAARAAVEALMD
jgi:beta-N-acetylhexosaminidase